MMCRDRLLRNLTKNNDQSLKDLCNKFRNQVTDSLRESKASYFFNYFQKNRSNIKQLWTGIKSVTNIRQLRKVLML